MKVQFTVPSEISYLVPTLEAFAAKELPDVQVDNHALLVDLLTDLVVNTRQIRLGGKPNPESLVKVRDVLRVMTDRKAPIPILVTSGPKKPGHNGDGVDLAELSALRILSCLARQVEKVYKPGVSIRVRLEDQTGYYLEGQSDSVVGAIKRYTTQYTRLASILHPSIHTFTEKPEMLEVARGLQPTFLSVLKGNAGRVVLESLKWYGPLSQAYIDSLMDKYQKIYPRFSYEEKLYMVASYLAATLARVHVGGTGEEDTDWAPVGAIKVVFVPPTPDTPLVNRTMFYRSIPVNQSKMNFPYWRARGVFEAESGRARMKLLPWHEDVACTPATLTLDSDDVQVTIAAPIVGA